MSKSTVAVAVLLSSTVNPHQTLHLASPTTRNSRSFSNIHVCSSTTHLDRGSVRCLRSPTSSALLPRTKTHAFVPSTGHSLRTQRMDTPSHASTAKRGRHPLSILAEEASCTPPPPPGAQDLKGKTVVVVGLAASGRAAARLALARGARVIGADISLDVLPLEEEGWAESARAEGRVRSELGPHDPATFLRADLLVLSPGVPPTIPVVQGARERGVAAVSELAFAAECLPRGLPTVAVTGTNGKSTVTTFTAQLLSQCGLRTFEGGNLGTPLSIAALALLEDPVAYSALVVEVSSYQMQLPGAFHPRVAAVLNISPDHLERHGDLRAYTAAKCQIFARMDSSDLSVLPSGDAALARAAEAAQGPGEPLGGGPARAWLGALPGVRVRGAGPGAPPAAQVRLPSAAGPREWLVGLGRLPEGIVGGHNVDNAATAVALALALQLAATGRLGGPPAAAPQQPPPAPAPASAAPAGRAWDGVSAEALEAAVGALRPLPHRMQLVARCLTRRLTCVDDSKATNVHATAVGLAGLQQPAVLLLGGQAKRDPAGGGLGFGQLAELLSQHRSVVTFGAAGREIAAELEGAGVACPVHRAGPAPPRTPEGGPQPQPAAQGGFGGAGGGLRSALAIALDCAQPGDAVVLSPGCASFDEFRSFEHRGQVFAALAQAALGPPAPPSSPDP